MNGGNVDSKKKYKIKMPRTWYTNLNGALSNYIY